MRGRVAAYLAALAMLMLVAVPPGFMVEGSDGGARIVICTGHGPLVVGSGERAKPGKMPKTSQAGACVFAGHGVSAPVVAVFLPASMRVAHVAVTAVSAPDLAPGRGLAAPPPPSHAPPHLTI